MVTNNNGTWSDWEDLCSGGLRVFGKPAVVFSTAINCLIVFVLVKDRSGTGYEIFSKKLNVTGTSWDSWSNLGAPDTGIGTSPFAFMDPALGSSIILGVGDKYRKIRFTTITSTGAIGTWGNSAFEIRSEITAMVWTPSNTTYVVDLLTKLRLNSPIFHIGRYVDTSHDVVWSECKVFSDFVYLTSAPAAASWGTGHACALIRGNDGKLRQCLYYSGNWNPSPVPINDIVIVSDPSLISLGKILICHFVGSDGHLYEIRGTPSDSGTAISWSSAIDLGSSSSVNTGDCEITALVNGEFVNGANGSKLLALNGASIRGGLMATDGEAVIYGGNTKINGVLITQSGDVILPRGSGIFFQSDLPIKTGYPDCYYRLGMRDGNGETIWFSHSDNNKDWTYDCAINAKGEVYADNIIFYQRENPWAYSGLGQYTQTYYISDESLKINLQPLSGILDKLEKIPASPSSGMISTVPWATKLLRAKSR